MSSVLFDKTTVIKIIELLTLTNSLSCQLLIETLTKETCPSPLYSNYASLIDPDLIIILIRGVWVWSVLYLSAALTNWVAVKIGYKIPLSNKMIGKFPSLIDNVSIGILQNVNQMLYISEC